MSGSDAGEALGLGFDHGAEVVAPERALLLEVAPDRCEVVIGKRFAQQLPVDPARVSGVGPSDV
jgi:hypothetical protein